MNLESNTAKHALLEIESLKSTEQEHIAIIFEEEILSICEKFGKMGHSGGSAPYYAMGIGNIISTLCLQYPISPLTGNDIEWVEVAVDGGNTLFQNKRDGRVFKNKEGLAWFNEAIVFNGDKTGAFTASSSVETKSKENVSSVGYIKSFPFIPKSFTINVEETEWADQEQTEEKQGGGWWSSVVIDDNQLKDAFEYYNKSALV